MRQLLVAVQGKLCLAFHLLTGSNIVLGNGPLNCKLGIGSRGGLGLQIEVLYTQIAC